MEFNDDIIIAVSVTRNVKSNPWLYTGKEEEEIELRLLNYLIELLFSPFLGGAKEI